MSRKLSDRELYHLAPPSTKNAVNLGIIDLQYEKITR